MKTELYDIIQEFLEAELIAVEKAIHPFSGEPGYMITYVDKDEEFQQCGMTKSFVDCLLVETYEVETEKDLREIYEEKE
jgi:hypothetical protein